MTLAARIKSACQDACAEFGEPPCYEVDPSWSIDNACEDCKRAFGLEIVEPIDPSAVVRPLM